MATTPYTVLELRARRKKLGDFGFMKQIADLLNAMETKIDKRQELLDAYRKAAISPDDPNAKSFWRSFGNGWRSFGKGAGEK
jgi:t-SNARE complex subunit (syntaxin)